MYSKLSIIACASGIAGSDARSGDGPLLIQHSDYLSNINLAINWIITLLPVDSSDGIEDTLVGLYTALAELVASEIKQKKPLLVIGGDHSCAIGTWSGVYEAIHDQGDLGLIWIDAHMDSHTPETTPSGNIHGMPVAVLLGHGYVSLTELALKHPKLKPENICLIGVRSFEAGEARLLKELNVRVYLMSEVKERGLAIVIKEAKEIVSKNTVGYGLSIDMDSIDPVDAPAVDVPEKDGIHAKEFLSALAMIANDPLLLAAEIVEFDPSHDENRMTEKLISQFIEILGKGLLQTKGK